MALLYLLNWFQFVSIREESVAQPDVEESFLTVAEVAEVLKLNQQTVRNWIDQGSLPALRVGRRVRIRRSDFERILSDGYNGGSTVTASGTAGPSAEDFWGGEPVGLAEPAPSREPGQAPSHDPGPGRPPVPEPPRAPVTGSESASSDRAAGAPLEPDGD
jgi:excisionase family DNA binding protein